MMKKQPNIPTHIHRNDKKMRALIDSRRRKFVELAADDEKDGLAGKARSADTSRLDNYMTNSNIL